MMFLKTVNIILVYKNIRIQDYKNTSKAISWQKPLARLTTSFQDFVLSLGRLRLRESLRQETFILSICGAAR